MSEFCIITVTYPSEDEARRIADILLDEKLAACIQMYNIKSSYIWEGKITNDTEVIIHIKTKSSLYSKIEKLIKQKHCYKVPEILKIPVINGLKVYLDWIEETVLED